jgi:hypothetical protein
VDQRVRRPVRPMRVGADLPPPLPGAGQAPGGRHGDRLADPLLVGRRRGDDAERLAGRRQRGPRLRVRRHGRARRAEGCPRDPRGVHADRVMPVGRPLPDVRSPSLSRGWVPFDEFARWERW